MRIKKETVNIQLDIAWFVHTKKSKLPVIVFQKQHLLSTLNKQKRLWNTFHILPSGTSIVEVQETEHKNMMCFHRFSCSILIKTISSIIISIIKSTISSCYKIIIMIIVSLTIYANICVYTFLFIYSHNTWQLMIIHNANWVMKNPNK